MIRVISHGLRSLDARFRDAVKGFNHHDILHDTSNAAAYVLFKKYFGRNLNVA